MSLLKLFEETAKEAITPAAAPPTTTPSSDPATPAAAPTTPTKSKPRRPVERLKEQVVINDVPLSTKKNLDLMAWSSMPMMFIGVRDAQTGFRYLSRVEKMLKVLGFPSFSTGNDIDSINVENIENNIERLTIIQSESEKFFENEKTRLDKEGKEILGFENRRNFVKSLVHWANNALDLVQRARDLRAQGSPRPLNFNEAATFVKVAPEDREKFLRHISNFLNGEPNQRNIIQSIDPVAQTYVANNGKNPTDHQVFEEIKRIFSMIPEAQSLNQQVRP